MREKINNYYEKVVASLRDAYYRIGVVDLKNNQIVKMDKKELEQEEAAAQEQYDSVIEFCAHHYVHPVDRIKFLQLSVLTANAFDDDREASKKAGMNAHLSKPVNIVQIEKILSAEVARARYFRKMKNGK